jgi:hypothetical protein
MFYRWNRKKPLVRYQNVMGTGREKGKVVSSPLKVVVGLGEKFEPNDAELRAFRDAMEPIGSSLVVQPDVEPESPRLHYQDVDEEEEREND